MNECPAQDAFISANKINYDGLRLGSSGEFEKARKKFEESLSYVPHLYPALLNLQICNDAISGFIKGETAKILFYILNENYTIQLHELKENLNDISNKDSHYAPKFIVAGMIFEKYKKYDDAELQYSDAIKNAPGFPLSFYAMGKLRNLMGKFQNAVNDLEKSLSFDSNFAPAYFELGFAYGNLNNYDLSIYNYEKALQLWPFWSGSLDIFKIYHKRGEQRLQHNQLQDAVSDFNRAIELNPGFYEAYLNRGIVYRNLRQYDNSLKDFEKTLQLKPGFTDAIYNRALVYKQTKQFEQAISGLEKTIFLDENNLNAHFSLGELYLTLKKYSRAVKEFNIVLKSDSTNYWAYYNKALALDNLRSFKAALAAYENFLKYAPKKYFDQIVFADDRIKKIKKYLSQEKNINH